MILSFMQKLPWGAPSHFEAKIKSGVKKHTIRTGKRWKPGHKIHFYSGSPRNGGTRMEVPHRVSSYWHYDKAVTASELESIEELGWGIPHSIAVPIVAAVEDVVLRFNPNFDIRVEIGGREILSYYEMVRLSFNDGLQLLDFNRYFCKQLEATEGGKIEAQLIHWTSNNLYEPSKAHVYRPETKPKE